MKLIKYCKKKYHINKAENIQIGTLNYYRYSDNEFVSDSKEGFVEKAEFIPVRRRMQLPNNLAPFLVNGLTSITPEGYFVDIPPSGKFATRFNKKFPNWYVFSCSKNINAQESTQQNMNCDSSYELKNIEEFKNIVSLAIMNYLATKYDFKKYSLVTPHAPIKYIKNDTAIFRTIPDQDDFFFLKDDNFSWQHEYRFLWILLDNEKHIIDVPDEPLFIPITEKLKNCFKF